jgi:hypothetical protein
LRQPVSLQKDKKKDLQKISASPAVWWAVKDSNLRPIEKALILFTVQNPAQVVPATRRLTAY